MCKIRKVNKKSEATAGVDGEATARVVLPKMRKVAKTTLVEAYCKLTSWAYPMGMAAPHGHGLCKRGDVVDLGVGGPCPPDNAMRVEWNPRVAALSVPISALRNIDEASTMDDGSRVGLRSEQNMCV